MCLYQPMYVGTVEKIPDVKKVDTSMDIKKTGTLRLQCDEVVAL